MAALYRETVAAVEAQQQRQQQGGFPMGAGDQQPTPGTASMGKGYGIGSGTAVTPPATAARDEGEDRGEKKRRSEGISQASPLDSGEPFQFGDSNKENRNPQYGRTGRRGNGLSTQDFMEALMTFFQLV